MRTPRGRCNPFGALLFLEADARTDALSARLMPELQVFTAQPVLLTAGIVQEWSTRVSLIFECTLQPGGGSCLVGPLTWVMRMDQGLSMAQRAPGEVICLSLHKQPMPSALDWAACAPCLG